MKRGRSVDSLDRTYRGFEEQEGGNDVNQAGCREEYPPGSG